MRINLLTSILLAAVVSSIAMLSFSAQAQNPTAPPPVPGMAQQRPTQGAGPAVGAAAPMGSQDPNSAQAQNGDAMPGYLTPFDYDPRGRRDPFQPPADEKPVEQGLRHGPFLPLQQFDLAQIKLSAIIWDVAHPKAMITDPDGKVYVVGPNTKIGKNNGYIAVIREGEMVVVETTEDNGRLMSVTRIVRLVSK